MNQKKLEQKRNKNARRLVHNSSIHRNCIRLNHSHSKAHEMKKAELCWELLQENKEFVSEAEFKEGSVRADIFVLDDSKLIEIETSNYRLEERKQHYPDDLKMIVIELD